MSGLRLVGNGLILVGVLVVGVGCAVWRSQIDPAAARYEQLASEGRPAAEKRLLLTISVQHPGLNQSQLEKRTSSYRNGAVHFLKDSGYFAEVGTSVTDPDLELVLNVTEEENFSDDLRVLSCFFTACVIPYYNRIEIRALGEVYSGKGDKLGELRVEEDMSVLTSLLLLPAIPSFYVAGSRAWQDVFRSVIVQMNEIEGIWK